MKSPIKTVIVLASLSLFACDKPEDAKPAEPATPATTALAPTTATNTNTATTVATQPKPADALTIADTDLVTSADYEAAAEKSITSKNYKTEIASLEAEIGKP